MPIGYQSMFAWYAGVKTGVLYVSRSYVGKHPHPLVNIYPIAGAGWKVFPSIVDPAQRRGLQAHGPRLPRLMRPCAPGARRPVADALR